jgi:uncharacterized protein (DUF1684 family)
MHPLCRTLIPGMVAASLAGLQAASPSQPVKLTRAAAEAVIKEIQKDRSDTENWLRSDPTSYLATIDRKAFGEKKTMTVGRAADNDVRIDNPAVALHHLRVTVNGDQFRVEAVDRQASFKIGKEEKRDATLGPSYLQVGRFTLRLSHQRFPAIIVFDPQSPRFKLYKGLEYFPVDLAYRYELPLTPNPKPETIIILSTLGHQRRALRAGWFDFMVGGTAYRLEATRLLEPGVGENDLAVFFRDATSGKETYSLGRYVDAKKLPSGQYLLDFNSAYNPACAFSIHYSCPIPPKANTLQVPIRAGEMDSHYEVKS